MNGPVITISLIVIAAIITYFVRKNGDEEAQATKDKIRKRELKKLLEGNEEREDKELYDIKLFWELIDKTSIRSNGSYKNQLGLLRDIFLTMDAKDLIKLDNTYNHFLLQGRSWDIYGASYIIFKSANPEYMDVLLSWLMTKGETVYSFIQTNHNLIINQEMKDLTLSTISAVIADVYFSTTKKFMPYYKFPEEPLPGEEWKSNEIPGRFPELWDKYA